MPERQHGERGVGRAVRQRRPVQAPAGVVRQRAHRLKQGWMRRLCVSVRVCGGREAGVGSERRRARPQNKKKTKHDVHGAHEQRTTLTRPWW